MDVADLTADDPDRLISYSEASFLSKTELPIQNTRHRQTAGTGGPGCRARGRWRGLAAVPVGGGAWTDNAATRRAKLAARTARGWAAAHGRIAQPGLTQQAALGTPAEPQAQATTGPHACGKPRPAEAGRGLRYPVGYEV